MSAINDASVFVPLDPFVNKFSHTQVQRQRMPRSTRTPTVFPSFQEGGGEGRHARGRGAG